MEDGTPGISTVTVEGRPGREMLPRVSAGTGGQRNRFVSFTSYSFAADPRGRGTYYWPLAQGWRQSMNSAGIRGLAQVGIA